MAKNTTRKLIGRDDKSIPVTVDSVIWALEFQRAVERKGMEMVWDTELLYVWFSNAIMAGFDARGRQERKTQTCQKRKNRNSKRNSAEQTATASSQSR